MPSRLRALIAALLVVAVALAGAVYLGYRSGLDAAQTADAPVDRVASLDLHSMFGDSAPNGRLVALAFRQVERVYYKPVEANTLIRGERKGILALLRAEHVANATLPDVRATADESHDVASLDRVLAFAQERYAPKLRGDAKTDLTQAALRGMLSSLGDPYTVYLSPQEISSLNESLDGGNFGGIGVFIYQLKSLDVILEPIEGLPAARAGMKGNEIVDTVNGVRTSGVPLDKVERLIRGEAGTTVTLVTHPYKKTAHRTYRIVREVIHVPTVHQKMTKEGYDYIRLSDFGQTSANEVHKALLAGKAHHARGYILDLRDNGGGLLDAAVDISSYFIPSGPIVSTIRRDGTKDVAEARGTALGSLQPLVVLVNKYTASASEITSGAIQDYKAGVLVGTKTFGKGVVQSIYPMPDNGALKITTARYLTPLGRDIQHKGIDPDVVVDQEPDPGLIDTPRDKQLAAAKARLATMTR